MQCIRDDVPTHAMHCTCIFRCDVIILYVYCIVSVMHNADALSCVQPLVSASLLLCDCTIGAGGKTTDAHAALQEDLGPPCVSIYVRIPCSGSSMHSGSGQCTGHNYYIFECIMNVMMT